METTFIAPRLAAWFKSAVAFVIFASSGFAGGNIPSFRIIDLGTTDSELLFGAQAVNNSHQVAGNTYSNTTHAAVWDDGVISEFALPNSTAADISSSGLVVGNIGLQAFSWKDGTYCFLDNKLPGSNQCWATGINASDQVVGYSGNNITGMPGWHAVVWDNGEMIDYGAPAEALSGVYAVGINDQGDITAHGAIYPEIVYRGALFADGIWSLLPSVDRTQGTRPNAINNARQIVGQAQSFGSASHAVLWDGDSMTDLGTLPGGTKSLAYSINNAGWVVGSSDGRAFFWVGGAMYDLTQQISCDAGWSRLGGAYDVSDNGAIVGGGTRFNGEYRSFLLIPDPGRCARPGDSDENCSVDLADYFGFYDCFAGPNHVPTPSVTWYCNCHFEYDFDGKISLNDFASFQRLFGE